MEWPTTVLCSNARELAETLPILEDGIVLCKLRVSRKRYSPATTLLGLCRRSPTGKTARIEDAKNR